jgi:hypothetical protein
LLGTERRKAGAPGKTNIEERWAKYIHERATRLRIRQEEAARPIDSEYLKALRSKAERLGVSIEKLVHEQDSRMKQYPTADCLVPPDLTNFTSAEELSPRIMNHLRVCPACYALLDMAAPHEDRLKVLLEQIRIQVTERAGTSDVDLSQLFDPARDNTTV